MSDEGCNISSLALMRAIRQQGRQPSLLAFGLLETDIRRAVQDLANEIATAGILAKRLRPLPPLPKAAPLVVRKP